MNTREEEGKRAVVLERLRLRPVGGRRAEKRSKAVNVALEGPIKNISSITATAWEGRPATLEA